MKQIGNERLYQAFIEGAKEVMTNRLLLNKINVFPVADGDTGNNLYSMMDSIITYSELKDSIKETLDSIAESAIIGARGNSGVIFAQYIQGLSSLDVQPAKFTREGFILATRKGASYAYKAVESPVEGTMITSMRVFHEALVKHNDSRISFMELIERAYLHVEYSVNQTTEQLIVLKNAAVVDSGAKGFAFFIKGFIDGLKGKTLNFDSNKSLVDFESFAEHEVLVINEFPEYRYCVEALIYNNRGKFSNLKEQILFYGDSVVVSYGRKYSRVHLHTDNPRKVFRFLTDSFEIRDQKVDDMFLQYRQLYQKKYNTVIVTDSIADLPQSAVDDGQVVVIPLDILIGNQNFIDRITIDNELLFELEKNMTSNATSSQPNIRKVEKILTGLLNIYEDIVVITVSKEMSGTHNVFKTVSQVFGHRIQVIDSKQNSVAQGLLVLEAIKMLKKGYNACEIRNGIDTLIPRSKILVSVKNLDKMVASGRLNIHLASFIKFFGLYPVISINNKGVGIVDKIVWGINNRQKRLLKSMYEVMKSNTIESFAVTYVDDKDEAEKFVKDIEKLLGIESEYIVQCSSVIAAGAGKGALAIAYIRK